MGKGQVCFPRKPCTVQTRLVFNARRRVANLASNTNGGCVVTRYRTTAECPLNKLQGGAGVRDDIHGAELVPARTTQQQASQA